MIVILGPKGITCILVEKGTPGLDFGKKERKVSGVPLRGFLKKLKGQPSSTFMLFTLMM